MLIEEFTKLTGYKPTIEEYAKIERDYSDFDGDKQEFCAIWNLNKALEKFPYSLRCDIRTALHYMLNELYAGGYKGTKHYRMLHNVFLNIDY